MAVTRPEHRIGIRFQTDLRAWEVGRWVMEALFHDDALTPERAAAFKDVTRRNGVPVAAVGDLKPLWEQTIILRSGGTSITAPASVEWRRWKAPAHVGSLQFAGRDQRGRPLDGSFRLDVKPSPRLPNMVDLFEALCTVLRPHAGMLVGPDRVEEPALRGEVSTCAERDARNRIP